MEAPAILGPKKKREIAYLLGLMFDSLSDYSAVAIEVIISRSVLPDVLNTTGYSADHLRVAMVEFNVLTRCASTGTHRLSENYHGLKFRSEQREAWLRTQLRESPLEAVDCPFCTRRQPARPDTILRHCLKMHASELQREAYWDAFIQDGAALALGKWFQ